MFSSRVMLKGAVCCAFLYSGVSMAQTPAQRDPAQRDPSQPNATQSDPSRSNPDRTQTDRTQQDRTTQTDRTQSDRPSTGAGQSPSLSKGSASRSTLSSPDEKFIMEAARGGHHEVEMGRMGVEKASSKEVKDFAQKIVD